MYTSRLNKNGGAALGGSCGNSLKALLLVIQCSNLCGGNNPIGMFVMVTATSQAISIAVQKQAGDSIHPICCNVVITMQVVETADIAVCMCM